MNPERYLLDTSALLTLIEDEAGADRVEQVLTQAEVWLPSLVLMEAYYIAHQEQGEAEADRRYALIKRLPVTILFTFHELAGDIKWKLLFAPLASQILV